MHSMTTERLEAQWSVQLLCTSVEKRMMSYKDVFNLFLTLSRFSDGYQRQTLSMNNVVLVSHGTDTDLVSSPRAQLNCTLLVGH